MSKVIIKEFQNNVFQFRADGYFNMTVAAKVFGKDLSNFTRSPDYIEYVAALKEFLNSNSVNSGVLNVVETRQGRYGGTWGHPKLIVFFARWLNTEFAIWCDMVIDDILNEKIEVTITNPVESMACKTQLSFPEALRLAAEIAEQNEKLQIK